MKCVFFFPFIFVLCMCPRVCPHMGLFHLSLFKMWLVSSLHLYTVSHWLREVSDQFSSVTQSDRMDCSTPGFPVHHQLLELTQTHVHWVSDAIQPSHPLSSPSPPAFNLSQYQDLFQGVSSSHQVAKILQFQLQHQSFQWIFITDCLRI